MKFIEFLFSFLFERNWHTGKRELSRTRTALFVSMIALCFLGALVILFLQTPVVYDGAHV